MDLEQRLINMIKKHENIIYGIIAIFACIMVVIFILVVSSHYLDDIQEYFKLSPGTKCVILYEKPIIDKNNSEDYTYSFYKAYFAMTLFPSIDVLNEYNNLLKIKDIIGMQKLDHEYYFKIVDSGTKMLILEKKYNYIKVRILSGKHYGEDGWISIKWIDLDYSYLNE